MNEEILVARRKHGVVWVTLNRPLSRNALSHAMTVRLAALARELAVDDMVRVVVITGAGDRAFCAGADLKERRTISAEDTEPYVDAICDAVNAWAALSKPTIAAVNGVAFGGGLELALACDFRVASAAAQFALTEVRLGIIPGAGGTQRLPRLIGVARAKELILLGRRINAPRSLEIGLVTAVASGEEFHIEVEALVNEFATCAPLSVVQAKAAIDRGTEVPIEEGLRIERACYNVTLFSDDRNEGLAAFADKRQPVYRGK